MSLAASTTYYYEVQAADKGGDSSPMSVEVSATTIPLPNPPAGLTATAASATKITLGWTEPGLPGGLPISSYKVFCSTSPSNLSQAGTAKTTSYSCLNLSPGTTYYCAVEAVDTAGDTSTMSATVSATTKALPNMPTNVTATANSATKVTVNWTETVPANGLPISNYKIYRGASPTCLSQVATRTTASYIDTTVSAGTYYYAIQASDTGGDVSAMSVPAAVTVP